MSTHLDDIIAKQHGSANVMVVFFDIIKYSLRKSVTQQRVINKFNITLQNACENTSRTFAPDAEKLNVNFSRDMIKIPTGDGAAIIFPFPSLQHIHLHFALSLLENAVGNRGNDECPIFSENGWCNCHDFFDVRVGIADGKAIIFKDINNSYNVAGNPVNIASRVMGLGDKQQILITEEAYKNLIDMTEDTTLESKFANHGTLDIKHNIKLKVYQYIGAGENYINKEIPMQGAYKQG